MKRRWALLAVSVLGAFLVSLILPRFRVSSEKTAMVSWYGGIFHGRTTASGVPYNMLALSAASPELPLGSRVRLIDPDSGRAVIVTINDRGPYAVDDRGEAIQPLRPHPERRFDLSLAAARKLGMVSRGVKKVNYQVLTSQSLPLDDGG
ncbi:MAG TPA: septal ring lytic transglycosylase RlpA family protein [bacterium]|nr:septal ring lytic transglycosylase RlpA family protein [bacterium]HPJ71690.1 septal ring lytic transglycosylase RlpA family protein [bacterium]HPQ67461.1 septal ring lytic transglycosylase RlpA family protein [bacterium]